jgi:hypothetical protein
VAQRYAGLDAKNDPLVKIDGIVPWEDFRPRPHTAPQPTAAKKLAESTHPWTVDIPVPLDGLGTRLTDMVDWCKEQGFEFAVHGHREHKAGDVPYDAMRFYFMAEGDAVAFRERWAD